MQIDSEYLLNSKNYLTQRGNSTKIILKTNLFINSHLTSIKNLSCACSFAFNI